MRSPIRKARNCYLICLMFDQAYLHCNSPFQSKSFHREASTQRNQGTTVACVAEIAVDGVVQELRAVAMVLIHAFMQAMEEERARI